MAHLTVTVLGGFRARVGSGPPLALPKKTQALLAFLALRPGREHTREKLTSLLWADADDTHARHSLRQALFGLRGKLGRARKVLVEAEAVALDPSGIDVDVVSFERLVGQGTAATLAEAARLYAGELLEGVSVGQAAFDEWLMVERERLREMAINALSKLLGHQSERATAEDALQTGIRILGLDPLQERAHRTLMQLYERHGRRASALRQYQVCVELLRRELGVEPEEETRELYQKILRQAPASGGERAQPSPPAERARPSRAAPRSVTQRARASVKARGAPTHETPLVGRALEAARMEEALDRAAQGHGQVLLLIGEEGIGKSRLVEHLASDAMRGGHRVLQAWCHETEQILPFRPWVDALREGGIVSEIDSLEESGPLWRIELSRLFPELGSPGVFPSGSREDYVRLFEAMTTVLGQVASRRPLVLMFEDLQWADDMTVRLFSFFGRRLRTSAVLLIGTARAEEVADTAVLRTALDELEREQPRARLLLGALSSTDTAALVVALAPTGSPGASMERIAERVWSVSEGNPFVIVETARALQERRRPGEEAAIALPPRVRDMIAARLSRLSDPARDVCALAAVIGEEFGFPLLADAMGVGHSETAKAVEELVRRRILTAVGERFHFTHDRIRAVAYDSLLVPARRSLHAAVARAMERGEADRLEEIYDRLAHHYGRADEPPRAIEYLVHFAEKARQRYAFDDASRSLDHALGLVDRLPAHERDRCRVDLTVRQGRVLSMLSRFRQILELLLPLRERLEKLDDPRLAGPYYFRLGLTYSYLNHQEEAAAAAARAIQEGRRCGDEATVGQALYVLSLTSYFLARPLEGVEQAREAVRALESAASRDWLGLAYWMLGFHYLFLGRFDAALDAEARAATIANETGDARLQSFAAFSAGWIHTTWGEWDLAIEASERGLEVARDRLSEAAARSYLGYAHLGKGDAGKAFPLLEHSLEEFMKLGLRQAAARVMGFLGEAHVQAGAIARARELALESLAINREVKHRWGIAYAERLLGRIAHAEGNPEGARQHLTDALATFADVPAPFEVGRTRLDLAELARARGDLEAAVTHVEDARRTFTELRVPRYVERAERLARELRADPLSGAGDQDHVSVESIGRSSRPSRGRKARAGPAET